MKRFSILLFIVCFFFNTQAFAQTTLQIEVFDVTQSKVVKAVPLDENTRNEAIKLVKSVECLYPKLNPTPKTGIMIKVPLGPPIKVNQTLIKKPVHEVIFIFPEAERPYMLIFNEQKNDPMFYYFSQDSAVFLKQMGIPQ